VQDLGLGFVATEQDVLPQLLSMYQQNQWSGLKPMPQTIETNGAQQAAQAILSLAARAVGRQSLRLDSLISKDRLGSHDRAASRPSSI
jgi:hypothetical protein